MSSLKSAVSAAIKLGSRSCRIIDTKILLELTILKKAKTIMYNGNEIMKLRHEKFQILHFAQFFSNDFYVTRLG